MIRYRRPKQDDPVIMQLIESQLVPLTSMETSQIEAVKKELPSRLGRGVTLVASPNYEAPPVGFVHFMLHGNLLYIDMLAVDSSVQRKRWGNQLMSHAERFAQSRGCSRTKVMVDDRNEKGILFYTKIGYVIQRHHSISKCYEMEKSLAPLC